MNRVVFKANYSAVARAASVDITPLHFPMPLAGFGPRYVAGRAEEGLEINALWFGDNRHAILLLSIDSLFACDALRDMVAAYAELPREAVVIAASHTHYAPTVDATKPALGGIDAGFQEQLKRAVHDLVDQLRGQELKPFKQKVGDAKTEAGVHRRVMWRLPHLGGRSKPIMLPGIRIAPNLDVPVRNLIRCNVLISADGDTEAPLAVLWSIACHPTRYHASDCVTSDYVGLVRDKIRLHFGVDVPILFLQGFSGDINPRQTAQKLPLTVKSLIRGPQSQPFSREGWCGWANEIASRLLSIIDHDSPTTNPSDVELTRTSFPRSDLIVGAADGEVEANFIRIGDLRIMMVGAEVVGHYEGALPTDVWGIGCSGAVFGYWPSNKQVEEGGYEGGGYFPAFGLQGSLVREPEAVFTWMVSALGLSV
jgi:hypothetical protein